MKIQYIGWFLGVDDKWGCECTVIVPTADQFADEHRTVYGYGRWKWLARWRAYRKAIHLCNRLAGTNDRRCRGGREMALIVRKEYQKDIRNRFGQLIECRVEGWFLFGRIRLYYRIIEEGKKIADSIDVRR